MPSHSGERAPAVCDPLPISVVVPAYNAQRFLGDALASVRRQTRPAAELIVVDDGSTDGTAAIAREFGARVISIANSGVANARNVGIRDSKTPWLAFLDADDIWLAPRLERQWAATRAAPDTLVVTSDYRYLPPQGREARPSGTVLPTMAPYRALRHDRIAPGVALASRADVCRALALGNFVAPSSLLVDRRLFREHDVYFGERSLLPAGDEFYVAEDYEWLLRALRFSDLLIVEEPLFEYRRSAQSMSGDGGRLKLGDVVLGELVAASPERYALGAAAALLERKPDQLFEAAVRYARVGDIVRAHATFERARSAGYARGRLVSKLAAAVATRTLARRAFAAAFVVWRRVARPLVRALWRES